LTSIEMRRTPDWGKGRADDSIGIRLRANWANMGHCSRGKGKKEQLNGNEVVGGDVKKKEMITNPQR